MAGRQTSKDPAGQDQLVAQMLSSLGCLFGSPSLARLDSTARRQHLNTACALVKEVVALSHSPMPLAESTLPSKLIEPLLDGLATAYERLPNQQAAYALLDDLVRAALALLDVVAPGCRDSPSSSDSHLFASPLVCRIARRLEQTPAPGPTALPDPTRLALLGLLQVAVPYVPPRVPLTAPRTAQDLDDFSTFLASDDDDDAWGAIDRLASAGLCGGCKGAADSSDAQQQLRGVLERVWILEGSATIR
jgi:hypothetical protein